MDENTKDKIRNILKEIFKQNSQITMISLSDETGLPITTFVRNDNGKGVEELTDTGITNRYAALAGASTSLGERTLSTISQQEKVKLIHVQGKSRDIGIAVSSHVIAMVVTQPGGNSSQIAEALSTQLKTLF
ncbi:MAG: hypothetical protein ACTSR2_03545 [Candidatus Hodarchaeales archaeon]